MWRDTNFTTGFLIGGLSVGVIALAVAFVVVATDDGPSDPQTVQIASDGDRSVTTSTGSEPQAGGKSSTAEHQAADTWPDGASGYTVILTSASERGDAEAAVSRITEDDAQAIKGTLKSDSYSSLNPGYWVAFVGFFGPDGQAAKSAAATYRASFPGAYARLVASWDQVEAENCNLPPPDGAGFFNLLAMNTDCGVAATVMDEWVGGCSGADQFCGVRSGFSCDYFDVGLEHAVIVCRSGNQAVQFETGA